MKKEICKFLKQNLSSIKEVIARREIIDSKYTMEEIEKCISENPELLKIHTELKQLTEW